MGVRSGPNSARHRHPPEDPLHSSSSCGPPQWWQRAAPTHLAHRIAQRDRIAAEQIGKLSGLAVFKPAVRPRKSSIEGADEIDVGQCVRPAAPAVALRLVTEARERPEQRVGADDVEGFGGVGR